MSDTDSTTATGLSTSSNKPPKKLPENDPAFRWLMPSPIYCDSYTAQGFSNGVVRISFGEYLGKEYSAIYRASIAMPIRDIRELHKTLGRIIKEYEDEQKAGDAASE